MLVQKFPKASQEKHLLRGFSFWSLVDRRWSLANPVSRERLTTTD